MDLDRLDALARSIAAAGSRRTLLGFLAAIPFAGGVTLVDPAAMDAKRRRRRRWCKPKRRARVCASKCGTVRNRRTCWKKVTCEPCCTVKPADDLQAAIDTAADGATLRLCAGTWVVTETLTIGKPLTLIGAGAGQTILYGADQRRVLAITADVPVTLQALTITRGKDTAGGGISNAGKLTLIDAALTANTATGSTDDDGGGAIWSTNDLTLRNTVVRENTSAGRAGGIRMDGGTLNLKAGSSIEENTAAAPGGGILCATCTMVLQSGSRLLENTASSGGGLANLSGTVTLKSGSQVTNNVAVNGGALSNDDGLVTIERNVLICGNNAPQCDGDVAGPGICPDSATCP
jgi:hypothetical protein